MSAIARPEILFLLLLGTLAGIGAEIMGAGGVIFSVVIWAIAIGLFLYARAMCNKGVLS